MTSIRKATVEDARRIQEILNVSWFTTYKEIFIERDLNTLTSKWHNLEKITKQISGNEYTYLVAELDTSVVGVCSGYLLNGSELSIEKLHVLPKYKGLEIGSKLLETLVHNFKKISLLKLEVVKQNVRAIKFYEGQGFSKTKEMEFIVDGVKVPCYVMEKPL